MKKILLGFLAASLSTGFITAQSMSFTVTTKNNSGSSSKANVFALWITNSSGTYVKTINRQSKNYTSDLINWKSNSGTKTTDGMTGASLPSHNYANCTNLTTNITTKRVPFTWDFKNYAGTLVADGAYYINIEFKEENTSRQYVKYAFTKGASSYTITPTVSSVTTGSCFMSPSLTYTAPAVALTTTEISNFNYTYDSSNRSLQVEYDPASHNIVELQLVNLKGQTIHRSFLKGSGKETISLPSCEKGIYLIRLTDNEGWSRTRKLLL